MYLSNVLCQEFTWDALCKGGCCQDLDFKAHNNQSVHQVVWGEPQE
jgi:hypothetical protein